MPRYWWLWCVVAGLLLSNTGQAQSQPAQQALDSVCTKYSLPALAAAIIEPGRIRYVWAGVRRTNQPDTLGLADYFHIGSNTKGVTSLLAAKLVSQHKLRWDTKLVDVVPELRGWVLPAYAAITLEELLSHRAGIQPYTAGADYAKLPEFAGTVSEKRLQFARCVLQQAPITPADGQAFVYSNAGYALVALMLERASQHSWEELVAHMMHKLKLHYALGFPNRQAARQPWGHWHQAPADSLWTPLGPMHPYRLRDYVASAGDLSMPLPDFARLVQLHLNGLLGKGKYVSASSYQALHFSRPAYAYGWGVLPVGNAGELASYHDGSAGTFYCHAMLYPRQKVAFVVLTNAGGDAAQQACYQLRRRLKKLYVAGLL